MEFYEHNDFANNVTIDNIVSAIDQISSFIKIIHEHDNIELEQLQNNHIIYFNPVISNYVTNSNYSDDSDDENEGIDYKDFVDNNMQLPAIKGKDEIVINMSYANIWFGFPCYGDSPVFKIKANNEKIGFTREELALKIFRRFHMLYFLYKNYDMEKGVISTEITESKQCFQPLCGEYDYCDNGIYGVEYNKTLDRWEVLCSYIH